MSGSAQAHVPGTWAMGWSGMDADCLQDREDGQRNVGKGSDCI